MKAWIPSPASLALGSLSPRAGRGLETMKAWIPSPASLALGSLSPRAGRGLG